jgi:hypothetical protein
LAFLAVDKLYSLRIGPGGGIVFDGERVRPLFEQSRDKFVGSLNGFGHTRQVSGVDDFVVVNAISRQELCLSNMNSDRLQSWRPAIRRNFDLKAVIPERLPVPLERCILQCLMLCTKLVPR